MASGEPLWQEAIPAVQNANDISLVTLYEQGRDAVLARISRGRHTPDLPQRRVIDFGCGHRPSWVVRGCPCRVLSTLNSRPLNYSAAQSNVRRMGRRDERETAESRSWKSRPAVCRGDDETNFAIDLGRFALGLAVGGSGGGRRGGWRLRPWRSRV